MSVHCPKCKSKNTRLVHTFNPDRWHSRCKKCGYESPKVKNMEKADRWTTDVPHYLPKTLGGRG